MTHWLAAWNKRLNGLPRRLALVAVTLGAAAAALWLLPYLWPFAAAFLFSRILEPFVHFATKGLFRIPCRQRRKVAAIAGMVLLFGLAGAVFTGIFSWLWREVNSFVRSLPQLMEWVNAQVLPAATNLYKRLGNLLPQNMMQLWQQSLHSLGQTAIQWAAALSAWVTSGAWSTATSIPHALLSVILTLMSTYYLTADRDRIAAFFHRTFPPSMLKRSRLIRANLLKALVGQLRSQLMISLFVMFFLMLTLGISGVRYGAAIGMLIGLADALPLFGAGVFLIPWSLVSFLIGQSGMGITLACLYLGTILIRQLLEPRLVGQQLGLYPLATMMAMYLGYRLLGFSGLLIGPVLLNLTKAVLDADLAATQGPT